MPAARAEEAWATGPGLTAKSPVFLASSRFLKQWAFVLWKLINTAYIFSWLMYGTVTLGALAYETATWWTYWVNGIYFVLSLATAVRLWVLAPHSGGSGWSPEALSRLPTMMRPLDWLERLQLLFQYPSAAAAPVVLLVYWGLLYRGAPLSFVDWNCHLFNSVQVALDMFLIASPFRVAHLWTVVLYAITYSVANIIFYEVDGTVVYDILDWADHPGWAVVVLAGMLFLVMPGCFLACYTASRLRENLWLRLRRRARARPQDAEASPGDWTRWVLQAQDGPDGGDGAAAADSVQSLLGPDPEFGVADGPASALASAS